MLSYLVHMYSCLRSLRKRQVQVGTKTQKVLLQQPCDLSSPMRSLSEGEIQVLQQIHKSSLRPRGSLTPLRGWSTHPQRREELPKQSHKQSGTNRFRKIRLGLDLQSEIQRSLMFGRKNVQSRPLKVCFIVLLCYSIFSPQAQAPVHCLTVMKFFNCKIKRMFLVRGLNVIQKKVLTCLKFEILES